MLVLRAGILTITAEVILSVDVCPCDILCPVQNVEYLVNHLVGLVFL